jgi:putative phage-type endonuclease
MSSAYIDIEDLPEVVQGNVPEIVIGAADPKATVKDRRGYLGGSDAAVIAGLSRFKTPFQLYQEKRGEKEQDDLSDNERVYWGNALEAVVAEEYAKRSGRKVRRVNGLILHKDRPYLGAHIDRLVLDSRRILECKTTDGSRAKDWDDGVPAYYLPQVQHYLGVMGREVCDVAVLMGGNRFEIFPVERDEEFISALFALESQFWNGVLQGLPPAPQTSEEASQRFSKFTPGTIFASPDQVSVVDELRKTKAEIKALEALEDELSLKVKTFFGDAGDTLLDGDKVVATWKGQVKSAVDNKALAAAHPDIVASFKKETSLRVMLIKG